MGIAIEQINSREHFLNSAHIGNFFTTFHRIPRCSIKCEIILRFQECEKKSFSSACIYTLHLNKNTEKGREFSFLFHKKWRKSKKLNVVRKTFFLLILDMKIFHS